MWSNSKVERAVDGKGDFGIGLPGGGVGVWGFVVVGGVLWLFVVFWGFGVEYTKFGSGGLGITESILNPSNSQLTKDT